MVDTRSNMQLSDLNYKPHGGKILRDIVYLAIGSCFYPPPGSEKYELLKLDKFHGTSHISYNHKKKNETTFVRI